MESDPIPQAHYLSQKLRDTNRTHVYQLPLLYLSTHAFELLHKRGDLLKH